MHIKIDKKIRNIIERDRNIIFTSTREHFPFVADHGDGDFAYDVSGNKFIDFTSFIGVYNLGVNGNKEIREAIKKQVDKLTHPAFLDFHAELPVTFAEKLVKMFPKGFGRVFFSNSGTEANEDAIKLSRLFTKRPYLISFYGAFHGRTMGSLGLTAARVAQKNHFGPFVDVIHAPYPNPYRCQFNTYTPKECADACLGYIEDNIFNKEAAPQEVAAIFIEPIQGEGGYIVPPKEFMQGLRKMADKNGILIVDDEIQAGYMRTGKFLALDNFGVTADIYTMAKGLGGGMPIGATIAKRSFGDTPPGSHAGTFGGNLLAMAAANASLDYLVRNMADIQEGVKRKGNYAMKRLKEMKERYEIIGDVRGIGLMIGIEFVKDRRTKEPAVKERDEITDECFNNGLLLLPAGASTIRIIPPLQISDKNLESGLDILEEAIKRQAYSEK
jgi:4-aminobutyrate aminotransferase